MLREVDIQVSNKEFCQEYNRKDQYPIINIIDEDTIVYGGGIRLSSQQFVKILADYLFAKPVFCVEENYEIPDDACMLDSEIFYLYAYTIKQLIDHVTDVPDSLKFKCSSAFEQELVKRLAKESFFHINIPVLEFAFRDPRVKHYGYSNSTFGNFVTRLTGLVDKEELEDRFELYDSVAEVNLSSSIAAMEKRLAYKLKYPLLDEYITEPTKEEKVKLLDAEDAFWCYSEGLHLLDIVNQNVNLFIEDLTAFLDGYGKPSVSVK